MMSTKYSNLNDDSQCRGHLVQFYKDDRYLTGAITEFVRQGLERTEAVILVCTQVHWEQIEDELKLTCPLYMNAISTGQLRQLDAYETLEKVLDSQSRLSAENFNGVVGGVYVPTIGKYERVRIYGELVDILCSQGRIPDAQTLEGHWNAFLAMHPNCSLLCGYASKNLPTDLDKQCVCLHHSDIIPEENMNKLDDPDELYRKIAKLELTIAMQGSEKSDQSKELLQTKMQLLQMGKLSILGEFSAGLAHEINNPLTLVMNLVGQLRRSLGASPPADIERNISKIEKSTDRMSKIVKNVLRFARQVPMTRQPISVQAAVQTAIELSQDAMQMNKISISVNMPVEELSCHGDEVILSQVFMNLFLNAKDAITSGRDTGGTIKVDITSTMDKVCIAVTDDGCGMDEPTFERMFFPFFTTKDVGRGTGLGLSVALTAIQQHGGHITCATFKGKGTRFEVTIPRSQRVLQTTAHFAAS